MFKYKPADDEGTIQFIFRFPSRVDDNGDFISAKKVNGETLPV